jgi:glycosyltransferase involved in cell wall biosynthesis
MHIGIDATCWHNRRGYGRHARALLSALVRLGSKNRYTLVMDALGHAEALPPTVEVRLVYSSRPTTLAASANGHRSLRDMWHMSRAMSNADFDLVLFPTIYSYVPVFGRAKRVVMIHDVIPERYPHLTLPNPAARVFWNAKVSLGRWQADALITVSDYSRQAILQQFNVEPGRVFVVGEASDAIFRVLDDPRPTPRLGALGIDGHGRTLVYVGGFGPHKNLAALVQGVSQLIAQEAFADLRLVLVGECDKEIFHSDFGSIKTQVERLGLADRVIFTGYLPDDELVVLLNLSTVLVLPSLMEGFGLPAVEAAACGCPVIATTASPLPTLLGEGGLYIDPTKQEELGAALARVLTSEPLRQQMRQAGIDAARRLTWDAAARQLMQLLHTLVGQ